MGSLDDLNHVVLIHCRVFTLVVRTAITFLSELKSQTTLCDRGYLDPCGTIVRYDIYRGSAP